MSHIDIERNQKLVAEFVMIAMVTTKLRVKFFSFIFSRITTIFYCLVSFLPVAFVVIMPK